MAEQAAPEKAPKKTAPVDDVKIDHPKDTRPTRAQYAALPRAHKRKHLALVDQDGQTISATALKALLQSIRDRRKMKKAPKPTVVNHRGATQLATGLRRV